MIYFRCEQCAGAIRADDGQAGAAVACPRCGRTNACPPETAARSVAAPSRSAPAVSFVRIGVGVLLLTSIGWAARNALRVAPQTLPAPEVTAPLSAADQRQEAILKLAIDNAPDPALVRVYDEVNFRHFRGQLPAIPVVWEPRLAEVGPLAAQAFTLEGMFGHIGDRSVILLNPSLSRDPDALRRALSHEMVHAWLYTIGDPSTDHGPSFQATLKRLSTEGAFTGIVANPQERESLRVWLEGESERIDTQHEQGRRESEAIALEARGIEEALAGLTARRNQSGQIEEAAVVAWRNRRDNHNRRVEEFRARADRNRSDQAAFNEQVERYNLMLAYPDGLDETGPLANRR